jgi:hypothetical protein
VNFTAFAGVLQSILFLFCSLSKISFFLFNKRQKTGRQASVLFDTFCAVICIFLQFYQTVKMGKKRKNKKMKVGFASVYILTLKGI